MTVTLLPYEERDEEVLGVRFRTKVFANISIVYVDKLDENEMTFSIKILIQLNWKDERIRLYNLKNDTNKGNIVESEIKDLLWKILDKTF